MKTREEQIAELVAQGMPKDLAPRAFDAFTFLLDNAQALLVEAETQPPEKARWLAYCFMQALTAHLRSNQHERLERAAHQEMPAAVAQYYDTPPLTATEVRPRVIDAIERRNRHELERAILELDKAVVCHFCLGFYKPHNQSPKRLARLKHSLTCTLLRGL